MIQEAIEYIKIKDEYQDQDFGTEEWMQEHEDFFEKIRYEFPDFSEVNQDIRDLNFRNKAAKAEVLARKVERTLDKYFDILTYCEMCKLCYELYQYCEDIDAEDDALVHAFGNMNVTKK